MVTIRLLQLLFSFLFVARVLASAVPSPRQPWINSRAVIVPKQNSTANSTTAAQQLANGIGFNIMAQQGEIEVLQAMMQLNQDGNTDLTFFNASKTNLQTFIQAGISIRVQNQALSKTNPQVSRGFAQLEQLQVMELALSNKLTGNATTDGDLLEQILENAQEAMSKNTGLQSLALGGSGVPMR